MIRQTLILLCILCAAVLLTGCKEDTVTAAAGEGILNGTVYDGSSRVALTGVTIQAQPAGTTAQTLVTSGDGNFSFTFTVDSAITLSIRFIKGGYHDTTFSVLLRSGNVNTVTVFLTPSTGVVPPAGGTGLAQTIAFLGAAPTEVSVYGVGGEETSVLRWEVRDSLGLPIDAAHSVNLNFSSVSGPGGGEYVSPPVLATSGSGGAVTTLNAGTRSGVVQILATATVGARTITSSPVQVIIRGGFPVQQRFSIASPAFNFAGLDRVAMAHSISVLAGDVYSNPVAEGTAIYFRSSAGVIQPSVFTNGGAGSVTLLSGNPMPIGAYSSGTDGYHYVVARTLGQGGAVVQDSLLLLWSGFGAIKNVAPLGAFTVPNAGETPFTFEVSDRLGHPLAAGTTISVVAQIPPPPAPGIQQNQAFVVFGNSGTLTLPDVITSGPGRTTFTFIVKDGTYTVTDATPVNITISVQGPNIEGTTTFTLAGTVN